MQPKVSIIITVFNREKYIEECARSLFEQSLNDLEYIFVNDASTDKSIVILNKIIKDYPARVPFIKIINLDKNGGVANARNIGIINSTGEYVIHADSDDWVDKDMYENLYRKAKYTDADIVGCDITHEYSNYKTIYRQKYGNTINDNISSLLLGDIHPSLCTSLTRLKLIKDNHLCFLSGLNMGEDLFFNLQLYTKANKIVNIHIAPYHYRHSQDSSSFHHTRQTIESGIAIGKKIEEYMKEIGEYQHFVDEIEYRKFSLKLSLVYNFDDINNYYYWLDTFPETHKNIWKYKRLNWIFRLQLWFAAHHMFSISKIIKKVIEFQHNLRAV